MINASAYEKNINLMHKCISKKGFIASLENTTNYKRVWTRDSTLCIIAAILSNDKKLLNSSKLTIITLFENQHKQGFMPSNVDNRGKVSYGGIVGRIDNNSWAIIGLCLFTLHTQDDSLCNKYKKNVQKCFEVLNSWEFNGKHLMYMPQSGDWADEHIFHGYTLFNQLLRVWALQLAAKLYKVKEWKQKANQIKKVIEHNFWNNKSMKNLYAPHLQHLLPKQKSLYWQLGFNAGCYYTYFDLQANALALYLEIGSLQQQKETIEFINDLFIKSKYQILPSFFPTVQNNDADWKMLKNNFAYSFRNKPYQFHNGGLWPVWNGFLVLALNKNKNKNKKLAEQITNGIYNANNINNQINECIDATTGKPCGTKFCTWSAAGAIIAENSFSKSLKN
jgi:glycogen debranching enzyme